MTKKKYWTAHEKGTDKAIVTIDASDDDLFHKTAKELGRPVNWRNYTDEENCEPKTIEVCSNNEWLHTFSAVDWSGIDACDMDDAADCFTESLHRHLEEAGFEPVSAKGQRSTCHGWNGVNTFRHKLGPCGSFQDMTGDERTLVLAAINQAESEMRAHIVG